MSVKTHDERNIIYLPAPEDWEAIQDRMMELDADVFQYLLIAERDHCKYEFNGDKPDYEFLGFLSHSLAQIQIVLELAKDVKTLTKMEMRFVRRTD